MIKTLTEFFGINENVKFHIDGMDDVFVIRNNSIWSYGGDLMGKDYISLNEVIGKDITVLNDDKLFNCELTKSERDLLLQFVNMYKNKNKITHILKKNSSIMLAKTNSNLQIEKVVEFDLTPEYSFKNLISDYAYTVDILKE